MSVRFRRAWWLGPLVAVVSVGAASADTQLIELIRNDDFATAAVRIEAGIDVNATLPDGTTALHWAVRRDTPEIVDQLVRAGANLNVTSRYNITPLMLASENGSAAMVERLLRAGADPNASPRGDSPLMIAARTGDVETVKMLLAHRADVNVNEPVRGQTALMWAVAEAHAGVAKALIDNGADVHARSTSGFSPLIFAVRKGDSESVRLLLAAGASPNEKAPDNNETSVLFVAIANGHYDLAVFLLDKGAALDSTDKAGRDVLHQVILTRNPNDEYAVAPVPTGELDSAGFLRAVLTRGANPNARANLRAISIGGSANYRRDPRKPKDGATGKPTEGQFRVVDSRVGDELDVDRGKRDGVTPFWVAAQEADAAAMRILAAGGADPQLPADNGSTPLLAAVGIYGPPTGGDARILPSPEAMFEAMQLAIELGNDPRAAVGAYGQTVLHAAVYGGGVESVIRFLVAHGARLDAKNARGETPLELAEVFMADHPNRDRAKELLRSLASEAAAAK